MDSLNAVGGQANVSYDFMLIGIDTITANGISAEAIFKLNSDGNYNLKIRAKSTTGANCSCESNIQSFKLDRLGTTEFRNTNSVSPNPIDAGSELNVRLGESLIIDNLILTTASGKQIYNWGKSTLKQEPIEIINITIPQVSAGLHFIEIQTKQGLSRLPVVIK